jgi:hypothetical protein
MLPEFLNVDMELESERSLELITREFGDKVNILYNGALERTGNLLAVEAYEVDDHDPDSIMRIFCDLIDGLSVKSKRVFRECSTRRFDIGIESGTPEGKRFKTLCLSLRPETLKRVSALSVEVVITVYTPEPSKAKSTAAIKLKAKKK